jgi:hypothetical protein
MLTQTTSFDEWWDTYKPIAQRNGEYRYETFGDELRVVMNTPPTYVWTEVEVEGEGIIVNGFARVNRLNYYITQVPWTQESIEVHDPDQTLLDLESFEQYAEDSDTEEFEMCGVCHDLIQKRKETA